MELFQQIDEIIGKISVPSGFAKPVVKLVYSGNFINLSLSWKGGQSSKPQPAAVPSAPPVKKVKTCRNDKEAKPHVKHKSPSRYRRDQQRWQARQKLWSDSVRSKEQPGAPAVPVSDISQPPARDAVSCPQGPPVAGVVQDQTSEFSCQTLSETCDKAVQNSPESCDAHSQTSSSPGRVEEPSPRPPEAHCFYATCEKSSKPGSVLKKCSKCKTATYCSINCQSADWPFHRRVCGIYRDATKNAPTHLEQ